MPLGPEIPDAREAYQVSRRNTKIERSITTQMVDRCAREILARARQGDTFCVFSCPLVKFGLPLYDARRITDYVGWNLERQGYKVIRVSPTSLFVSWFEPKAGSGPPRPPEGQPANLRAALAVARSLGKQEKHEQGRHKKRH